MGFFSGADEVEEDEIDDFLEAAAALKSRVRYKPIYLCSCGNSNVYLLDSIYSIQSDKHTTFKYTIVCYSMTYTSPW